MRNFSAGTTFTLDRGQRAAANDITDLAERQRCSARQQLAHRVQRRPRSSTSTACTTWNAAFNGGAAQSTFYPGANVFVRAQISDPFGSFDIGSARITIIDPGQRRRR